ncbi:MAG: ChbG/HpnK family deacetylase [Burkholderiaceae bacterium]
MPKIEPKRIVICADDFGMNPAIDAGILELGRAGRLNATSCLSLGPSFSASAPALQECTGLQAGLHLNFTESLGQSGLYLPVSALIARAWLRRLDPRRIHAQIASQLDAFENAMGRRPDFVDGHQHVHQFPQIRDALLAELDRRYADARPWLRYTHSASLAGMPAALRLKARVIDALGARCFGRLARRRGFRLNRRFLGVYDFQGGQAVYAELLRQWLSLAADGDAIMCHPAGQALPGDGLGEQRLAEYQVLRGDALGGWLQEYGVSLCAAPPVAPMSSGAGQY